MFHILLFSFLRRLLSSPPFCVFFIGLSGQLLFLLHQDVVLLFKIGPAPVLRFLIQMESVLPADIKKHRPAGGIKSLFPVIQLTGFLVRVRKVETQSFKCFFLLRCDLAITVFTIEDVPLMDVGRDLIQVQGPVQNMNVLTTAALKVLKELCRDLGQNFRRHRLLHCPDLDQ